MKNPIHSNPVKAAIAAACITGSLTGCLGGGGGGGNSDFGVDNVCLSALTSALGDLPIVSAAVLDNLSPDQLTSLTSSLASMLSLPVGDLGDLLSLIDSGAVSADQVDCALENGLAAQGITDPSQLLPGELANLLSVLDPSTLTDLIGNFDLANPLGGLDGLLGAVQSGDLPIADVTDLVLGALTQSGDATALLASPDLFAAGLGDALAVLDNGLPGGLAGLSDLDVLDLANAINASNSIGDLGSLEAVVANLANNLSVDATSELTDAVLGGVLAASPDQFVPGLGNLLGVLAGGFPGGLDALPAGDLLVLADALDLANAMDSLAPVEDALAAITGGLSPDVASSITDTVLGSLLAAAPDQFVPGLGDLLGLLGGELPGGLDALPAGDLLALGDALNLANAMDSLAPVESALAGITGGLSPDVASSITDTVLGGLLMASPDQFVPGFGGVLADLSNTLPGGLDGLPAGDVLDLANALDVADATDSLAPVEDVLNSVTAGLGGDAVSLVTDTVLGTVGNLLGLNNILGT